MKRMLFICMLIALQAGVFAQPKPEEGYRIDGKMYFTTDADAILSETFDTTKASNNFNMMDDIYVRVYLKHPLADIYRSFHYTYDYKKVYNHYNYALRIFVDNSLKLQWLDELNKDEFNRATTLNYTLASSSDPMKEEFSSIVNDWVEMVSQLSSGKHDIRIEMLPLNRENGGEELPVIAMGRFTYTVERDEIHQFEKQKSTGLPESTLEITGLEDQFLEAATVVFDDAVPVKAVITDVNGDWTYLKDLNGDITGRQIIVSVVFAFPTKNICLLKTCQFYQSHQGNGDYDEPIFSKMVSGYYDYEVDCNNLKE